MAELNKLLVIDEAVLVAMAGNPNFVSEFPFLANAFTAKKSGCGRCSRAAAARVGQVNTVKNSIVSLGAEKKQKLKTLLNAEKVRIRVAHGNKVTDYTF
jgi:hypothetical protein